MKTACRFFALFVLVSSMVTARAATTIDAVNKYGYGANIGWMDWTGDGANGAVMGAYVCSGYIYSANVGWINLGSGSPTNGIYYQNISSNDFGVNQDGLGNLRGFAYGANIGWINFESNGAPKINMLTGQMSGYVWSANCGWISLSNSLAYVQTDTIFPGILDSNGMPIAWDLLNFGTTNVNPNADPDHDGVSNYQEYLAGTNPNNGADYLHITGFGTTTNGTNATLVWASVPTRYYHIQEALALSPATWANNGIGLVPSGGASTSQGITDSSATTRFYRIQAVQPLTP